MNVEAVIDEVIIEPDKIQPIIIEFQNGELVDTEARKMKSGVFYNEKNGKTIVAMSNGQVVYKGDRPDPEEESTYTMLAIHNRKTGKVRLVQAERWQVAPVLDREPERNDALDGNRVMLLNRTFGSKTVQRRTEQYEKMKVNIDGVKGELKNSADDVEIDRNELITKTDGKLSSDLPPCNRSATIAEDVYNVYDLIPKDILQELQSKIGEIKAQERSSAFYTRISKIVKDGAQTDKKIAILEYIYSISNWLNMPIKDAKKRMNDICPVSLETSRYILDTYSVNSSTGRLRPASVRDVGILHCLILTLMISNFELNLELFSTLISGRYGLKKLADLSRLIGASAHRGDSKSVVLKVPLPTAPSLVPRIKKKNL